MNAMLRTCCIILLICAITWNAGAQSRQMIWSADGKGYYSLEAGRVVFKDIRSGDTLHLVTPAMLTPGGAASAIRPASFSFSSDYKKLLLFTNTRKVWRYHTRGDYWVLDLNNQVLFRLGENLPEASLMFAKFSPDGKAVAYMSGNNIYTQQLDSRQQQQLTHDGGEKIINGSFDWAYEEEFFCRDGFRWAPDSKRIAYWQANLGETKQYLMVNNTDSIYPSLVPVDYPVAGEPITPYRIGIVSLQDAQTRWMSIPGDPLQHYLPRMEWVPNGTQIIVQQLNRKQNISRIMTADIHSGQTKLVMEEKDSAWIDITANWDQDYANGGWDWLNGGKEFLWASEQSGWRQLYRVSLDGKQLRVTTGDFDIMDITAIDEKNGDVYFMASPQNATQKYLYRTRLNGKGSAERISPSAQVGTHSYRIAPVSLLASHSFSNYYTRPSTEWVSLPGHNWISGARISETVTASAPKAAENPIRFFSVTTADGIDMDGWMSLPKDFDSTKKYPVLFYVYTEPWGQLVTDQFGVGFNHLYRGDMAADGYIYMALDNRGTPVPKGRQWRKSVYRKIGVTNIRDQAMAAREILKWNFVDSSRIAVWGWSGGGSATLNLMFQYPDIYKTGIAVAAVANQLTYDNIYQERYMGLPGENPEDFIQGSPVTHAKNLQGKLLYIHGTGDDNVHYNNAEMLINELVRHNKQFQFMAYPNRSHGISEGEGTSLHLSTLFTNFLKEHCPPGGR